MPLNMVVLNTIFLLSFKRKMMECQTVNGIPEFKFNSLGKKFSRLFLKELLFFHLVLPFLNQNPRKLFNDLF